MAILLDGEFVRMVLARRLKRYPTADEIMAEVERILNEPCVSDYSLYRIFYYTADPLKGTAKNPWQFVAVRFYFKVGRSDGPQRKRCLPGRSRR